MRLAGSEIFLQVAVFFRGECVTRRYRGQSWQLLSEKILSFSFFFFFFLPLERLEKACLTLQEFPMLLFAGASGD